MRIVWLLFLISSSSFARKAVEASDYIHLTFTAKQIAEMPLLEDSSLPLWKNIAKTKNRVELDLYLIPDDEDAPAFLEIRFNARRNDKVWTDYQILQPAQVVASEEINFQYISLMRKVIIAGGEFKQKLLPVQTMAYAIEVECGDETHWPRNLTNITFCLGKDQSQLQIDQVFENGQVAQDVEFGKMFRGVTQVEEMTPEVLVKIRELLLLHPKCGQWFTPAERKSSVHRRAN